MRTLSNKLSSTTHELRTLALLVVVSMAVASALAQTPEHCVSVPSVAPTVDGILTGAGIAPTGGGTGHNACGADAAWAGVVADNIPVVTTPDTQGVNLFLAGHKSGANLDKLYVGVHVQITPSLSTNDHVTLYFHFGGGGTFTGPDFALTYDIGAAPGTPDATPSDSQCNVDAASIRYYTFSGANWAVQNTFSNGVWAFPGSTPDGKILSKKSWDFNPADDTEAGIWEVELSIDLNALGITVPASGAGLKIGAKVYLHDDVLNADTTYYYPMTLTDVNNDGPLASSGNITTPGSLQQLAVGSCVNDVAITQISSTDAKGNPNSFTLPVFNNGSTTTPNHFTAKVKFFNPADPNDSSPVGTANTGQVQFHILPWSGGFLGDYTMSTPTASFTRLNQEVTIPNFVWPQTTTQWNDPQGNSQPPSVTMTGANHACLRVVLSGFNINIPNTNDTMQINLNYTHASTIKDSFLISNKQQGRQKEQRVEPYYDDEGYRNYILRVNWRNLPNTAGWKYAFPNVGPLHMKKLHEGYYLLQLRRDEEKRVPIAITGGTMPGVSKTYKIVANAGGYLLSPPSGTPPVAVPVKPNTVVTVLALGMIRVNSDAQPNDANGFGPPKQLGITELASSHRIFLLQPGYYQPLDRQGALLGSFDNFKTAFVVGTDSTFLVPDKVTTLYLAINDEAGQYKDNTGQFEVHVNFNKPLVLPTSIGQVADMKEGIPVQMDAGNNLPRLDIDVFEWNKKQKLLLPTGYLSWAIYASTPTKK